MKNSETKDTLPEGWILSELGNISNINMGQSPPSSSYNVNKIGLPFFQGKSEFGDIYPKVEKYCSIPLKIVDAEDVLISVRAPIGPTNLAKTQSCIGRGLAGIKGFGGIPNKFILYQLRCFEKELEKLGTGTTFKAVSKNILETFPFVLPPLEEQHRIVARIEELFSELDHAEEALKKAQKQLEVYKQALLKSAFKGKLTEKWREENSEYDAIDQLKKIKAERNFSTVALENKLSTEISFERSTVINTWASAILENLIGIYARIGWKGLTKDEYTEKGPLFLSVYSLNYGKTVAFHQANHISIDRYEESPEIKLQINDILLCKDGAGIGKVGIVKHLPDKATVNSSLLVIRSFEAFIPDFLYYLFLGPSMQKIVGEKISGSAIPHLFQKDIKQFSLQVPPIEEQQQIVQELESRFTLIDELELAIASGLSKTNVFRQSILKKTFEGRLQPQFSHEEKAMELLERIQIEKENYLLEQKTIEKQKPRKVIPMETNKSILEVLQEISDPIAPKELWLRSKHKDNIEDFYSELKEIYSLLKEVKEDTQSLISLKG